MDYYAAWMLTPSYYGPNQEFDFLAGLGVSTNGHTLGQGRDEFARDAGDLNG